MKRFAPFTIYYLLFTTLLVVFSRFVGIDWGMPYPMHPDEWNIARAVEQLTCNFHIFKLAHFHITQCGDPHFYAYGQATIYAARAIMPIVGGVNTMERAIMSLRLLSALASLVTVFFGIRIVRELWAENRPENVGWLTRMRERFLRFSRNDSLINNDETGSRDYGVVLAFLALTFSPALIQFAHFGTTESVLMALYTALCYVTLKHANGNLSIIRYGVWSGALVGVAAAVKVSSFVFVVPVAMSLLFPVFRFLLQARLGRFFGRFRRLGPKGHPPLGDALPTWSKGPSPSGGNTRLASLGSVLLGSLRSSPPATRFLFSIKGLIPRELSLRHLFCVMLNLVQHPWIPDQAPMGPRWGPFGVRDDGYLASSCLRGLSFPKTFLAIAVSVVSAIGCFILFSPQNVIHWSEFVSALDYESAVGMGRVRVFYTQSFDGTSWWYPLKYVFPYALGWPTYLFAFAGLALLPWRSRSYNVLRLYVLSYLVMTTFTYTKWVRFYAPVFPLLVIVASCFVCEFWIYARRFFGPFDQRRICLGFATVLMCVAGVAYLSIYTQQDVRFSASRWINAQQWDNSVHVLSETANVVDLPLIPPGEPYVPAQFSYTSFDFYHVDEDALLASSLLAELGKADYILVPSRRIYMNYTCERPDGIRTQNYQSAHCRALRNRYPILNDYYRQLFDGSLGYRPEAMFTRYPTLSLFGLRIWEFPDERAEEAWSVFDHPVVRIYKRGGQ